MLRDQVAVSQEPGVSQEMPQPEGAPQGVAEQEAVDAGKLQEQLDELKQANVESKEKHEQDLGRLRSTLDSSFAQKEQSYQSRVEEAEQRMHSAAMANLDEQEKIAYQLDVARERNTRLQGQMEQARQESEASRGMMGYAKGFMAQGVKFEDLDFSSLENMYASGWSNLQTHNAERDTQLQDALATINTYKAGQPAAPVTQGSTIQVLPQTPVPPTAPPVVSQHGAQPSGVKTMGEVIRAVEAQFPGQKFDEDKIFTWIERRHLSPNILDGIDFTKASL